jgi:hypothetical protein
MTLPFGLSKGFKFICQAQGICFGLLQISWMNVKCAVRSIHQILLQVPPFLYSTSFEKHWGNLSIYLFYHFLGVLYLHIPILLEQII